MPRSLVLADDHPILLDALDRIFVAHGGFTVVERCVNGRETIDAVVRLRPEALVLDLRMPQGGGIAVLREISARRLMTRTVLLTAAPEDPEISEAVRLGVWGIVLKEMAPSVLVGCLLSVCEGKRELGRFAAFRRRESSPPLREDRVPPEALTPREIAIVREVSAGRRTREVATRLGISEGTVKIHLHHIYAKWNVEGRVELLLVAQRNGIL
jgi:DNA-binding NarL/FixJ family response regulator